MAREWQRGGYLVTTDKGRLDLALVHNFLKTSYWAAGIPADVVLRSVENSLTFGLFRDDEQVGFTRVVTDYAPSPTSSYWSRIAGGAWAGG
jgi:hypothetical protein